MKNVLVVYNMPTYVTITALINIFSVGYAIPLFAHVLESPIGTGSAMGMVIFATEEETAFVREMFRTFMTLEIIDSERPFASR